MKKRIMGVFLAVGMVFALLPAAVWAVGEPFLNNGGDGTEDSPYEINDLEQLEAFRDYINADDDGGSGEYFKLTANIDMTDKYGAGGTSWTPIGDSYPGFDGEFDGAGHTVKVSLSYTDSTVYYVGLFGLVYDDATISNLSVSGSISSMNDNAAVGGIAGDIYGHIESCYSSVNITGKGSIGGIAGRSTIGHIINSYNTGNITNSSARNDHGTGGIVGDNYEWIESCYNTGKITLAEGGAAAVGGIAGTGNSGTVSNCYYLTGTAEKGVGVVSSDGYCTVEDVAAKNTDEFKTLASTLNDGLDVWKDSPLLGRPVFTAFPEGGDGTEATPYTIPDLATLEAFREYINSGKGKGEYFKLTAEIDMSDKYGVSKTSWTPIGTNSNSFKGTFDGGGHTISGLYISTTTDTKQGLFGNSSGTIKNLSVSGSVTGNGRVGGIVGENISGGVISDCINNCSVTGNSNYVGGIVGYNYGNIKNCYNTGTVSNNRNNKYIGGIAGWNNSTGSIENCHNRGTITGAGDYAGGIAGSNNGSGRIENCYNTGAVNGTSSIGGIAGSNDSSNFENCYNTGSINGTSSIGGIAGLNNGSLENCYYLNTGAKGEGTSKTEDEFKSGEVAWLLQSKQDTPDQQVWGQKLSDEADAYPVLTTDTSKKVLKVTFATQENKDYAAKYTNPDGTVEMPENPSKDNYTFARWAKTQAADGEKFDGSTGVTEDMTVYAVGRDHFGGDSADITLSETYGYDAPLTVNLDTYMEYANKSVAAEGKFTYNIESDVNSTNASIESSNMLSVPTGLDADDYTITVKATEKTPQYSLMSVDSYGTEAVTLTVKVSIAKAPATVTAPTAKKLTYNGAAQELVTAGIIESVSVSDCGTMQYSLDGDTYSADIPTGKDAGTYTVYWKVDGADKTNYNYVGKTSGQVTATIGKAASEVTVTASENPTYGSEITLTATVTATGVTDKNNVTGTVQFKVGGVELGTAADVDTSTGTATLTIGTNDSDLQKKLFGDAGTTNVTAVYSGNDNIAESEESVEKSVTVSQKVLSYTVSAVSREYNGSDAITVTLTPSDKLYNDDVTLSATGTLSSADVDEYEQVNLSGITVGGAAAKYYKVDADSKNDVNLNSPINITKANVGAITAPTVETNLTYNGEDQELIETVGNATGGTMKYYVGEKGVSTKPDGEVEWKDAADIKGKDAGTYTIWYYVEGDGNHNDTTPASITVKIEQKTVELTWTGHEGLTYTGSAHTISATVSNKEDGDEVDVTVAVTANDEGGNASDATATNAGSYTAEATQLTGTAAGNYKLPDNPTQTFNIAKATVTFTIDGTTTFTYSTALHTVNVNEGEDDTKLPSAGNPYSVIYADNDEETRTGETTDGKTDVGTYGVWVKLSTDAYKNYMFEGDKQEFKVGTMEITKAALTLTVSGTAITYGQTLSESELNGTATIGDSTEIDGTWAWDDGSVYPTVAASGTTKYTVTFTPSGGAENFTDSSKSTTITIEVKPFTLTPQVDSVAGKVYDGTTTVTGSPTLKFAEDLDKAPFNTNKPTVTGNFEFIDKNVGESKYVKVTDISISATDAGNYQLSTTIIESAETTAEITAKSVTLEWENNTDLTYDGTAKNVTAEISDGKVEADDLSVTVAGGNQVNANKTGEQYTATATLTGDDATNYSLSNATQDYTIAPAEVSFTIGAEDKVAWSTRGETNADPNPDGYESTGSGTNYALEMTYDSYTHTANVKQTDDEAVKINAGAANGYKVTYKKDDAGDGLANVRNVGTYGIYVTINPVAENVYNFKFAGQEANVYELKIGEIEIKPYEVTVIWTHLSYVYHAHTMHPDIRVQNPFKSDNNQLSPGEGLPSDFNIEYPENYDGEYLVAFGATDGSDVKEYTVTAKLYGQKAANYTVKNPTATVTIVPAPVTFTVSDNVWNLTGEHPTAVTLSPVWGVVSTTPDKDEGTDHQYPDPGTKIDAELNTKIVYKMDGEEITAPEVPTKAGTYEVWVEIGNTNFRHSATSDGASHKVGELVLTDNPASVKTYTVTFDAGYEGGTAPEDMENLLEGQMVILPAGLTREGYLFQGWSHGGITYRPNEEFPMPASDVTFKAEWLDESETRKVGGKVLQEVEGGDPKPLLGATATLKQGDNEAGEAITDASGEFSFENLTPGIYNLEIRYFNGSSTVIKTFRVDVEKNDMAGETYILPDGALNTVVDADVTAVVDMQDIVETPDDDGIYTNADVAIVEDGGTVEFKMTVKGTELDSDQIEELPVSEEQIGMVLDLELTKTVAGSSSDGTTEIHDSKVPITTVIHLPAEIQGKSGYTVYRFHTVEGVEELQTITTSRNASGEYLQVIRGGTAIEIHATLYSTYVLTWYQSSPVVDMSGRVTVADTPHGAVTPNYPNAAPGVKVTLTVTPDEGYTVDSVTVTDRNGNVLPLTDNGDGTYTFTMPGGDVTVKAIFKLKPCDGGADCPSRKFPDLDVNAWYHEYTDYVILNGLMNGNNLGLFDPDGTVTRATVVMTLWNYENRPVANYAMQFTDVKEGQWYTEAIRWAASEGIVGGYGDSTFQPDKPVNREELAKILYGYEQKYGSGGFKGDWMFPLAFADSAEVSDWAYESVAWCTMNGVITGKPGNLFDPAGSAKRTDLAAMLTRYFQLAEDAE